MCRCWRQGDADVSIESWELRKGLAVHSTQKSAVLITRRSMVSDLIPGTIRSLGKGDSMRLGS